MKKCINSPEFFHSHILDYSHVKKLGLICPSKGEKCFFMGIPPF